MEWSTAEWGGARTELASAEERARLVRLCARLTGDPHSAEDLAQETLLEAWRHLAQLRDPARRPQWLAGIARNVCLRWLRRQHAERQRREAPRAGYGHEQQESNTLAANALDALADPNDLEIALEREELADLLDRALGLLPAESRQILVARCIEMVPQAEVAARLGLSEGAVAMRLQRGKLALRRLLASDLRAEALAYGLAPAEPDIWQETRQWCSYCGTHRLLGRFDSEQGDLRIRCPACTPAPESYISQWALSGDFGGLAPAIRQAERWGTRFYREAVLRQTVPCPACRQLAQVLFVRFEEIPVGWYVRPGEHGLRVQCSACGITNHTTLTGIANTQPAMSAFRRAHRRLRVLPERPVSVSGREAALLRLESLTDAAWLEMALATDTYETLAVDGRGVDE
jgi:RNA polymerase sigma-70 factor (ECF subfamily)